MTLFPLVLGQVPHHPPPTTPAQVQINYEPSHSRHSNRLPLFERGMLRRSFHRGSPWGSASAASASRRRAAVAPERNRAALTRTPRRTAAAVVVGPPRPQGERLLHGNSHARPQRFGDAPCGFPSNKARIRLRPGAAPALFSTLVLPEDAYYRYFVGPRAAPEDDIDSHQQSSATMLACSSRTPDSKGMSARLWEWMHQWWEYCRRLLQMAVRGTEIVVVLSPLALLTPASIAASRAFGSPVMADATWAYAMKSVHHLGPAFVKLCQWIATRRDLFPPHVCDRLSKLHDRGVPHSWRYTKSQLVQAFGRDYETRGLVVHPEVIGCGSAAQVHRGTLKTTTTTRTEAAAPGSARDGDTSTDPGVREVAVKVLHPRFGPMVERDLRFLQTAAELLHGLPIDAVHMLNLPRAVETFGAVLQRQADLRIEGSNLKQFRENFYYASDKEREASSIVFPCPMEGWVDANVLVEELVQDAIPIAEYLRDSSESGKEIRKELASPLLRAFLKMVFIDNFIHSDLHPGNVLIQTSLVADDGRLGSDVRRRLEPWFGSRMLDGVLGPVPSESEPSQPRVRRTIVFLDAGIATSLSPEDQRNLHDLFHAVILNDGDRAGRIMVERAKYERCSLVPGGVEAFSSGIRDLVAEFHDCRKQGLTLGAVRIGSLLSRVLDLCRVHGVEIDPSMASVVISTLVLEGLGRSLAPSLNLIDFAVPFILGRGRV